MSAPESPRRRFEKLQPVEVVEITTETTGTGPAGVFQVDGPTGAITPIEKNTSESRTTTESSFVVGGRPTALTVKCAKCGAELIQYSAGYILAIEKPLVIKCDRCHG